MQVTIHLHRASQAQTRPQRGGQPGRDHRRDLAVGIPLSCLLALMLQPAPCVAQPAAAHQRAERNQAVELSQARAGAASAGAVQLGQQPGPNRLGGRVEVAAAVAPQCSAVANQGAQQKCQHGQGRVPQHPNQVSSAVDHERSSPGRSAWGNAALAAATFVLGFSMAGGFGSR